MITAACYEHRPFMHTEARRLEFTDKLKRGCSASGSRVEAWVVLPNHYHLLVETPGLSAFGRTIRHVHGSTSHHWNLEDDQPGRKCWFRFSDRAIRSDAHYFAALNYIHANPVKHLYVESALDWSSSSVHEFESEFGVDMLRDLWARYPVGRMGSGWDD